jgi:hypothetical protein
MTSETEKMLPAVPCIGGGWRVTEDSDEAGSVALLVVYRITLETPNPVRHRSRNEAIRAHADVGKEQSEGEYE